MSTEVRGVFLPRRGTPAWLTVPETPPLAYLFLGGGGGGEIILSLKTHSLLGRGQPRGLSDNRERDRRGEAGLS